MRIIRTDLPEGNAHAIMGIVSDMLYQIWGRGPEGREKVSEYAEKAMSGNYENLKKVSMETVPGLIDFATSDEVEVEYKRRDVDNEDDESDDLDIFDELEDEEDEYDEES